MSLEGVPLLVRVRPSFRPIAGFSEKLVLHTECKTSLGGKNTARVLAFALHCTSILAFWVVVFHFT